MWTISFPFLRIQIEESEKREFCEAPEPPVRTEVCGEGGGGIGIDYTNSVRRCMSFFCYEQIYAFDEPEPGEIDVRERSFKGCSLKYWNKELSIRQCKSLSVRKTNNLASGDIRMISMNKAHDTQRLFLIHELMSKTCLQDQYSGLTASYIYGWA